ncbi:hypothetical protein MBLNU13_g08952t1 [Cladosporium sp. NU13]
MAQPFSFGMREREKDVGPKRSHSSRYLSLSALSAVTPFPAPLYQGGPTPYQPQTPLTVAIIGIVCRHALSGINTPIGPTTIPAAVTRLCATCASFDKIAQELSTRHKQWQDSVRAYNWTYFTIALDLRTPNFRHPQEEDIVNDSKFKDYLTERKRLARHYERLRLEYELNACRLQGFVDPALPIVDLDGVALLPVHGNEPSTAPKADQATLHRVRFDENQQHPSRETARRHMQFKRIQRGPRSKANAYRPGRYADPTGRVWENTSSPVLYQSGDGSSAIDMPVNPFAFTETSSWGSSAASRDSVSKAEDTCARGCDASQEGKTSPFLAPLVIYTPSSPLPQQQKVQEEQGEESSLA